MKITRRGWLWASAPALWPRRTASDVPPPRTSPPTRILLGGDVMLSRHVAELAHARSDPAWPLHGIAPLLSAADIAFVNLEAPFSDHPRNVSGMVFQAEPDMIAGLVEAGVDVVSTANNHARDCGSYGMQFTLDWLDQHGIAAVGTGDTAEAAHRGAVLERNGVRFGFLAYTFDQSNGNYTDRDERVATMDVRRMAADVAGLRERADVVLVSMHAGWEYQKRPNPQQRQFARAAIDAGARVVAGHHPHVLQPLEGYAGGLIFYSLGNLVFDQVQRKDTQCGWIAEVRFIGPRLSGYRILTKCGD